jgi:hypothetical protein
MTTRTRAVAVALATVAAVASLAAGCSGADQPKSAAAVSPSAVTPSGGGPADTRRTGSAQRTDAIPDGVYRKNVSEADLVAVGQEDAFRDFGVQT